MDKEVLKPAERAGAVSGLGGLGVKFRVLDFRMFWGLGFRFKSGFRVWGFKMF